VNARSPVRWSSSNQAVRRRGFAFLILLFAVISVLLPSVDHYQLGLLLVFMLNLILVVSFRFMITMDRWSFCHIPLAGMGGYTSAILTVKLGWSFWPTVVLGGLVAAAIGFLLSYPVLRTRGFYFFQSTFVAGAVIAWSWTYFFNPFGGVTGIYGVDRPTSLLGLVALDFNSPVAFGYLLVGVTSVSLLVLYHLEHIRFGAALKAIGANADLAKSVGIGVLGYEVRAFVVGCFFAGVAGVMMTNYLGIAYPNEFAPLLGINLVMYTIVGGRSNFWGPILGLVVLTWIGELIRDFIEYIPLVFGVLTIITVLVLPGGLISLPALFKPAFARLWGLRKAAE
jgi:branched-chain amino acid transport system permease protein